MKRLVILSVLLGLLAACSSNQSPSENSTTKTTNNSIATYTEPLVEVRDSL